MAENGGDAKVTNAEIVDAAEKGIGHAEFQIDKVTQETQFSTFSGIAFLVDNESGETSYFFWIMATFW